MLDSGLHGPGFPARDDLFAPASASPPPRRRRRTRLLIALAALVTLAIAAGVVFFTASSRLAGNIRKEQVTDLGVRPIGGNGINILLIGSDSRSGDNGKYGDEPGERSDTTLLLHLSGDSKSATAVSIPRDSMVQIPSCTKADGTVTGPIFTTFNAAYSRAGAGCTMKTVEQLTGVRIAHFISVDFTGFKSMVDALGSVPVCVPEAIDDKDSHLVLSAGQHDLDGEQALGYVRVRHIGNGSDLSRIDRQQTFLSSMIQTATSAGVLTNPVKLYSFLSAATSSMVTDADFSSRQIASLANSVRGIGMDKISFVTVPVETYPENKNRVQWAPGADTVWRTLASDEPVNPPAKKVGGAPAVTTPPADVRVKVLNGTSTPGLAAKAAADLRRQGFLVTGTGNADRSDYASSVVKRGADYDESGRTLSASVPGSSVVVATSAGRTLQLVIGADYKGTRAVKVTSSADTVPTRTADQSIC